MVIKVLNLSKCVEKINNIALLDLSPVMERSAEKLIKEAKIRAPVDTGLLKGSITRKPLNGSYSKGAIVFTPVEYGLYQEFGTVKMRAQPFMIPAFYATRSQIEQDVQKFINDKLRIIAK